MRQGRPEETGPVFLPRFHALLRELGLPREQRARLQRIAAKYERRIHEFNDFANRVLGKSGDLTGEHLKSNKHFKSVCDNLTEYVCRLFTRTIVVYLHTLPPPDAFEAHLDIITDVFVKLAAEWWMTYTRGWLNVDLDRLADPGDLIYLDDKDDPSSSFHPSAQVWGMLDANASELRVQAARLFEYSLRPGGLNAARAKRVEECRSALEQPSAPTPESYEAPAEWLEKPARPMPPPVIAERAVGTPGQVAAPKSSEEAVEEPGKPAAPTPTEEVAGPGVPPPEQAAVSRTKLKYPNRAEWLKREMKAHGVSSSELQLKYGGPDHKTTDNVRNGKYAADSSLSRIAAALSKVPLPDGTKRPVSATDFPDD